MGLEYHRLKLVANKLHRRERDGRRRAGRPPLRAASAPGSRRYEAELRDFVGIPVPTPDPEPAAQEAAAGEETAADDTGNGTGN